MKIVLAFLFFGFLIEPAFAEAGQGHYISIRAGGGALSVGGERDAGWTIAGAFGWREDLKRNMAFRSEVEIGFNHFSGHANGAQFNTNAGTIMTNFYLDFMTDRRLRPYLGLGIGTVDFEQQATVQGAPVSSMRDNVWAWGFYGGLAFDMNDEGNVIGDVGVRHLIMSAFGVDLSMTSVNAGVRLLF